MGAQRPSKEGGGGGGGREGGKGSKQNEGDKKQGKSEHAGFFMSCYTLRSLSSLLSTYY